MPVYNREHVLRDAMKSVLAQTHQNFEFLIIDDGSEDASVEIVESFDDPRIRLVVHDENQGIPRTRNHGLELARGEFWGHADSDDLLYPNRMARQIGYLDAHPEIAAVGCWMSRMDDGGRPILAPLLRPTDPREIRGRILFATCFKNPTMVARTEVMREFGFREQFAICEDLDLWARVSVKYGLANLPEFLMRYRSGGTSHQIESPLQHMRELVAWDQLRELPISFDERDVKNHVVLRNLGKFAPDTEFLEWGEAWLRRLIAANGECGCFPEPEFSRAAAERWLLLQYRAIATGTRPRVGGAARGLSLLAGGLHGYSGRGLGLMRGVISELRGG